MEKVTITQIYRSWKDKNDKPLMGRNGKPYERVNIKTREHGSETWLGGFGSKFNENWREGDEVELEITKAGDKGQYLNFKVLSRMDLLEKRIEVLENK